MAGWNLVTLENVLSMWAKRPGEAGVGFGRGELLCPLP
jgi:hypothetical protein